MKTAFLLAVSAVAAPAQAARAQAVWPCETTVEIDREPRNPLLTDPQIALADRLKKRFDLKGKTVLLNIWATWCAPCREERPQIEGLSGTLKGRRLWLW